MQWHEIKHSRVFSILRTIPCIFSFSTSFLVMVKMFQKSSPTLQFSCTRFPFSMNHVAIKLNSVHTWSVWRDLVTPANPPSELLLKTLHHNSMEMRRKSSESCAPRMIGDCDKNKFRRVAFITFTHPQLRSLPGDSIHKIFSVRRTKNSIQFIAPHTEGFLRFDFSF